jgi:hypothetical protein
VTIGGKCDCDIYSNSSNHNRLDHGVRGDRTLCASAGTIICLLVSRFTYSQPIGRATVASSQAENDKPTACAFEADFVARYRCSIKNCGAVESCQNLRSSRRK